jgi:hypothetical protein
VGAGVAAAEPDVVKAAVLPQGFKVIRCIAREVFAALPQTVAG